MEKEATKFFEMVLNNSSEIIKEIKLEIYKTLDLEGKILMPNSNDNTRILEQIKEGIDNFQFNIIENNFLKQIEEIVKEELQKFQSNNNYELLETSLIEKLKELRNIDIPFEDDFKNLSNKVSNQIISSDMFYNYFISKKEKINEMINSHNQDIINSLINLTPRLIKELQENNNVNNNNVQTQHQNNSNSKEQAQSSTQLIEASIIKQEMLDLFQKQIDDIANYWDKYLELDNVVPKKNQINGISKIAKYCRKITKTIKDIQSNNIIVESMTQEQSKNFYNKLLLERVPEHNEIMKIIEKYKKGVKSVETKLNAFVVEIRAKISSTNNINELLTYKNELEKATKKYQYLKNEQLDLELLNVINKIVDLTAPEKNAPKAPNSPNPLSAEIGGTNESMNQLIESGSYFSVLQGIPNKNIDKYKNFVNNGFKVIFDKWKTIAEQAKTQDQRMKSYEELKEIYKQFKDYISMDISNNIREMIANMEKYFENHRQKNDIDLEGRRHNTLKEQQTQRHAARR